MSAGRVLIWSSDAGFAAAVSDELRRRQIEALRCSGLISVHPQPDLILADVDALPPTWWKSVAALRKRDGSLAVIIVGSALPSFARLRAWRPRGYVRRPFRMEELIRVVQEVLRDVQALDRSAVDPDGPSLVARQDDQGESLAAENAA